MDDILRFLFLEILELKTGNPLVLSRTKFVRLSLNQLKLSNTLVDF